MVAKDQPGWLRAPYLWSEVARAWVVCDSTTKGKPLCLAWSFWYRPKASGLILHWIDEENTGSPVATGHWASRKGGATLLVIVQRPATSSQTNDSSRALVKDTRGAWARISTFSHPWIGPAWDCWEPTSLDQLGWFSMGQVREEKHHCKKNMSQGSQGKVEVGELQRLAWHGEGWLLSLPCGWSPLCQSAFSRELHDGCPMCVLQTARTVSSALRNPSPSQNQDSWISGWWMGQSSARLAKLPYLWRAWASEDCLRFLWGMALSQEKVSWLCAISKASDSLVLLPLHGGAIRMCMFAGTCGGVQAFVENWADSSSTSPTMYSKVAQICARVAEVESLQTLVAAEGNDTLSSFAKGHPSGWCCHATQDDFGWIWTLAKPTGFIAQERWSVGSCEKADRLHEVALGFSILCRALAFGDLLTAAPWWVPKAADEFAQDGTYSAESFSYSSGSGAGQLASYLFPTAADNCGALESRGWGSRFGLSCTDQAEANPGEEDKEIPKQELPRSAPSLGAPGGWSIKTSEQRREPRGTQSPQVPLAADESRTAKQEAAPKNGEWGSRWIVLRRIGWQKLLRFLLKGSSAFKESTMLLASPVKATFIYMLNNA